ncbi:hypothetical protein GDO78_015799 [Eleutherodactylus coqui]|uniref:Uncharacterized protein n=1 Tax=Eleutherodactylus coqui TaxID=57060 RepID=A0A8J6E3W0_ELECQ|nr:hypothetical protein GDO78_015799 [Eleutherodactylus coqui]
MTRLSSSTFFGTPGGLEYVVCVRVQRANDAALLNPGNSRPKSSFRLNSEIYRLRDFKCGSKGTVRLAAQAKTSNKKQPFH